MEGKVEEWKLIIEIWMYEDNNKRWKCIDNKAITLHPANLLTCPTTVYHIMATVETALTYEQDQERGEGQAQGEVQGAEVG